jgi:hypothetical protein
MFPCSHRIVFDGTDQENSKKKKEKMEETKRRDFYICRGSHTSVFSIGQERPQATALSRTHSYGNLPYNTTTLIKNLGKKHTHTHTTTAPPAHKIIRIISRNLEKRNIHTTGPRVFFSIL